MTSDLLPPAFGDLYRNRRVLVTGHTGFKGAWLCEWLLGLGAQVTGYSLAAPTSPALSELLGLRSRLDHVEADVRDRERLAAVVRAAAPDFVFHLAAQPLVRESYRTPVATFEVNVLGTVHLLEALRGWDRPCAAVLVTSDKCYENRDWLFGYREDDALGGADPYSASKGAAEIAIASWRRSFFASHPVRVASGRAGNVIGGGDWAQDRILPDCIRALSAGQPITVRNPAARRPWQHVLEPLSGYLWLAAVLARPELRPFAPAQYTGAFNFGPGHEANRTVAELVTEVVKHWPGRWEDGSDPRAPHEARWLGLATDKASTLLGWTPVWDFATGVAETLRWYRAVHEGPAGTTEVRTLTAAQIARYTAAAHSLGLPWASGVCQRAML